jgi:3-isopropylmalate/(R)-2-methylmalate dehydratase large subunit
MAGMTITEKILARHAGVDRVAPGETVWVEADVLMTHDVCGPGAIGILKRELGPDARVWDPEKVVIIPDHFIFTKDADSNRNVNVIREFAAEQGLKYFYDVGTPAYKGVCHVALAEEGHTRPGEVLFGTDSHTCTAGAFGLFATGIGNTDAAFVMGTGKLWLRVPETIRVTLDGEIPAYLTAKDMILALIGSIGVDGATYAALEFAGPAVTALDMAERMTLCNMAIECGAKSGIVPPDDKTLAFLKGRTDKPFDPVHSDPDAVFLDELRFDMASMAPKVARPHSPDNVVDAADAEETKVDRCYIGSCTGGKTEDFQRAAEILDGRTVKVDTFCVPATTAVANDLVTLKRNGRTLQEILESAGAHMGPPSCAACLGGPVDTFGRLNGAQTCISTTNRNFPGRMGSADSAVYLASPYTVAASALTGHITDPRAYL